MQTANISRYILTDLIRLAEMHYIDGMNDSMMPGITREAWVSKPPIDPTHGIKLRKTRSLSSLGSQGAITESQNSKSTRTFVDEGPTDATALGQSLGERPAILFQTLVGVGNGRDSPSQSLPLSPSTTLRSSSNGSNRDRLRSLDGTKDQRKTPPTSPPRNKITDSIDGLLEPHSSFFLSGAASRTKYDSEAAYTAKREVSTSPSAPEAADREDLNNENNLNGSSAYLSQSGSVDSQNAAPPAAFLNETVNPVHYPSASKSKSKTYTPSFRPSDIIKVVPRPVFPIRARNEAPLAFSAKAQSSKMKWTHTRHHFTPDAYWLVEPDIADIKETVWPWLEYLGAEQDSISVSFMAEGGFHKV